MSCIGRGCLCDYIAGIDRCTGASWFRQFLILGFHTVLEEGNFSVFH